MSNRLQHSTSPYLRQHADNPVDWYEWGEEAFAAAQQRQVPILLSIGYSSCHWCHVMAHESFSDPKTAAEMNRMFVNIKVDREERPDIDHIYMTALQALTGQGGWPLTAWLTPDREPFYTGTYFPPTDRPGHPSFGKVMDFVDRVWREERERVTEQTQQIMAVLNQQFPTGTEPVGSEWRQQAQTTAQERFDPQFGGFGSAPKFAQPPVLDWLLTEITDQDSPFATTAKQMLSTTLSAMERGGIKDLIGGGFARYAVDRTWLVPHFEKMLYDNASLLSIYARAGRELDQPRFIEVAKSIAQYLARDLQHPAGGFYAAEDADSEGVEGKFYVWSWEELLQVCGDRLEIFAALTGASPAGNFEGSNILHHAQTSAQVASDYGIDTEGVEKIFAELSAQLYQVRSERIRPMRDEKIISGWNGLAIGGLSHLAAVTGDHTYIQLAEAASRFVLENLVKDDRLHRSWSDGEIGALGFAEDYGAMATGLFSLYQVTGDLGWCEQASQLTRSVPERFGSGSGGFYDTSVDHEQLISRPRDWLDNPIPSGNSLCIEALMMLAAYTGEEEWHQQVTQGFTAAAPLLESYPLGVGHLAAQAVSNSSQHPEVAVAGPQAAAWVDKLGKTGGLGRYYLAWDRENQSDPPPVPLLEGRSPSEVTQGFVCSGFVCQQPANSIDLLLSQLQR